MAEEKNGKILAMFEMLRDDIARLDKRFDNLPCSDNIEHIRTNSDYVNKQLKNEEVARHTFIKEIVKYAVPAIIVGIIIVGANMLGLM